MRSMQLLDSRRGWNTPSLFSSAMDDYVELDTIPARKTSQRPIAAVAPLNAFEYQQRKVSAVQLATPAQHQPLNTAQQYESEIDYVSICPQSTKALEKLSSNRGVPPPMLKKSNSVSALNRRYSAGTNNSTKHRQQIEDDTLRHLPPLQPVVLT
uniref:Uncharacterized protein n=1 Tax=Ditylenchus dipsaci TaxID=166011 RepID=A0A915D2H4_9BILA